MERLKNRTVLCPDNIDSQVQLLSGRKMSDCPINGVYIEMHKNLYKKNGALFLFVAYITTLVALNLSNLSSRDKEGTYLEGNGKFIG